MNPEDFMQLRPDTPGYINYTQAGRSAAADNKPKPFDASKTFRSIKEASGIGDRDSNFNTAKSRMALPLSDTARSGSESFSKSTQSTPQSSVNTDFDLYNKLSDRSLQDRGAMGNQDIDLTKRKSKEVDTLANNEANRAMGMQLATQFPYKKYETESSSAREMMSSSLGAIPTFLNRATASRINPVSLSL